MDICSKTNIALNGAVGQVDNCLMETILKMLARSPIADKNRTDCVLQVVCNKGLALNLRQRLSTVLGIKVRKKGLFGRFK
jgi:hypothetical protein